METAWWVSAALAVASFAIQFQKPYDKAWFATLRSRYVAIPPARTFQIVWPILLSLTAVSYLLIATHRPHSPTRRATRAHSLHLHHSNTARLKALTWLNVNLALNFAWSALFFGQHWKGAAVVDSVACWVALVVAVGYAWRVRPVAGYLLVPYVLWLSFGTFLGFSIYMY